MNNQKPQPTMRLVSSVECDEPTEDTLDVRHRSYKDCRHRSKIIDVQLRKVTCKQCGEQLDPFDCLLEKAQEDRSLDWRVQMIRDFDAKEAAKRKKQYELRIKPMRNLVGSAADSFHEFGGTRFNRLWITIFSHRQTRAQICFSKDGRFWARTGGREWREISPDDAKRIATSLPSTSPLSPQRTAADADATAP